MNRAALHSADAAAIAAVLAARPAWTGMARAGGALRLDRNIFLHAGPSFGGPANVTAPILNSAAVAAVFEDLAPDLDAGADMVRKGAIRLEPAQDHDVTTPLAAVVSPGMWLHVVADRATPGRQAYAPINGGSGPAPRLGQRTEAALAHIRWLHGPFAGLLAGAAGEGVDLIALAAEGLRAGDDCHGRTPAATAALARIVGPRFGAGDVADAGRKFLAEGPAFFLNLWMAAARCMLDAANGLKGSSLVVAAGANGARAGIQLAGLPGRWFTAAAAPPNGALMAGFGPERALGAIGDSAIVDVLGFGAMAMSYAPEQKKALGSFMPPRGFELPALLLARVHPGFGDLAVRVGVTARAVVAAGETPAVSLGILDRLGEAGRIGGGIHQAPIALYREALAALDAAG